MSNKTCVECRYMLHKDTFEVCTHSMTETSMFGKACKHFAPPTNGDAIRQMNTSGLIDVISCPYPNKECIHRSMNGYACRCCKRDWLNASAEIEVEERRKRMSKKIKIVRAEQEYLEFSDGSTITSQHDQDCCEYNYADFTAIDDLAREWEFEHPILFEGLEYGFRFGNENKMVFVPCYSEQNGYYSDSVNIYFNDEPVFESLTCEYKDCEE